LFIVVDAVEVGAREEAHFNFVSLDARTTGAF
jgi:hypothetical protein